MIALLIVVSEDHISKSLHEDYDAIAQVPTAFGHHLRKTCPTLTPARASTLRGVCMNWPESIIVKLSILAFYKSPKNGDGVDTMCFLIVSSSKDRKPAS